MAKTQASRIAGFIALGFFVALFFTSLDTPAIWFRIIYGGIAISSVIAIYRWRVERQRDAKASSAGLWIVVAIAVLLLFICIILPSI